MVCLHWVCDVGLGRHDVVDVFVDGYGHSVACIRRRFLREKWGGSGDEIAAAGVTSWMTFTGLPWRHLRVIDDVLDYDGEEE